MEIYFFIEFIKYLKNILRSKETNLLKIFFKNQPYYYYNLI